MEDREIKEYRDLMLPPGSFEEGFNIRTVMAILFIGLIVAPGSMYLQLVAGGSLGPAAEWVVVILFAEIARRSFTTLKRQEVFVIYFAAGALIAAETGAFNGLLWNQYLPQSSAAKGFGVDHLIPGWFAPAADSEAILHRTFFHRDWLMPILVMILEVIIARASWFCMGYFLFRITSDVEKLPFPMAPLSAMGATALAETTGKTQTWRWRIFSIGAVMGMVFAVVYVGIPAVTGAFLPAPLTILPIPWLDLTQTTQQILPAAAVGVTLNIGVILTGMVLPFWVVVGGFLGAMLEILLNPVLYHMGVLRHWHPGMGTVETAFVNRVDFWMSFGIGLACAIFVIGMKTVLGVFRKGAKASGGSLRPPTGRGDFPLRIALAVYVIASCGSILLCRWLIPGFPVMFFILFALLIVPVNSYINARMIGLTGQFVGIPMLRQGTFILSGYRGADIWFAPVPLDNYGFFAQKFREMELTGTRLSSLIKAEIFMVPIVLVCSVLFWQVLWRQGPIPSSQYPYAQKMWHMQALNQCLWVTGTLQSGTPESPGRVTSWTPPAQLADGTLWYFRCRVKQGAFLSGWSETRRFRVDVFDTSASMFPSADSGQTADAPRILYPPDGAVLHTQTPELRVRNADFLPDRDAPVSYMFEIDRSPSFDSKDLQTSETKLWLKEAVKPGWIGLGFGLGMGAYVLLQALGAPVMLIFGFLRSMGHLPHMIIPEILGALLGRYYFQRKFGRDRWRQYAPVLAVGFVCGTGLISMASIALALIIRSVNQAVF